MNTLCRILGIMWMVFGIIGAIVIAFVFGSLMKISGLAMVYFLLVLFSSFSQGSILLGISAILENVEQRGYAFYNNNPGNTFLSGVEKVSNAASEKDGWICSCGRTNPGYVTTCACGRGKS